MVTLDLAESDHAHRERCARDLGEPYRTLLGHLRHEIGHYYWPLLVDGRPSSSAAARCSATSAPTTSRRSTPLRARARRRLAGRYVSAYATMHPWEDWAETFAHYLHIRDTLQTAAAFGVERGRAAGGRRRAAPLHSVPAAARDDFARAARRLAAAHLRAQRHHRSLGDDDLYPFVLAPAVIDKLAFVDELHPVRRSAHDRPARHRRRRDGPVHGVPRVRARRRVTVLERGRVGDPATASYGRTRSFRNDYLDADYARLAREAFRLWGEFERQTGTEVLVRCGCLNLAKASVTPDLDATYAELSTRRSTRLGLRDRALDAAALRERYPYLDADLGHLDPDGGVVDLPAVRGALTRARSRERGVRDPRGRRDAGDRARRRRRPRRHRRRRVRARARSW